MKSRCPKHCTAAHCPSAPACLETLTQLYPTSLEPAGTWERCRKIGHRKSLQPNWSLCLHRSLRSGSSEQHLVTSCSEKRKVKMLQALVCDLSGCHTITSQLALEFNVSYGDQQTRFQKLSFVYEQTVLVFINVTKYLK